MYSVIPFRSGRDAMSAISDGIKYDVALIDLSLSDTGGTQVMEMSKSAYPNVPVIGMSGYSQRAHISDTHFQKPFDENDIDRWIRSELKMI